MNLIEKLGGYEKANSKLLKMDKILKEVYYSHSDAQKANELRQALLEYRRQHNIFEVGDWVVFKYPNDSLNRDGLGKGEVLEIKEINFMDYLIFKYSDHGYGQGRFIHATDAEIKAGKRLEVSDGNSN